MCVFVCVCVHTCARARVCAKGHPEQLKTGKFKTDKGKYFFTQRYSVETTCFAHQKFQIWSIAFPGRPTKLPTWNLSLAGVAGQVALVLPLNFEFAIAPCKEGCK